MKAQRMTAVGVFENPEDAQKAVKELKRAGFREDEIGIAGRDSKTVSGGTEVKDKGSHATTGAAAGLAAGAGIGALWGIGIIAGLLPAIGPAIAGGTLATILSSAAAGAAAVGLAGALIGLGLPEEEAKYYEGEFHAGRTIVTVRSETKYDEAVAILRRFGAYDYTSASSRPTARSSTATVASPQTVTEQCSTGTTHSAASTQAASSSRGGRVVQAHEEELHVHKTPVQAGEVSIRKEVHTEQKTIQVPVKKEEIVIERHAVAGRPASASDMTAGGEIRVPVREEQVHVEKQPVVREEVTVGKRQVEDTETVSGTVRKEQIKVEKKGDVDVKEKRS